MGIRVDSPPIVFSLVMATMGIAGSGASHGSDAPDAALAVDASVSLDAAGPSDGPTFTSQDGGVPAALSLSVAPSATTLVVTDLAALPSTTFVVTAKLADGTTAHGNASWSVDRLDIATVGAGDGVVTAAGAAFGTATVTASAFGLTAQATITIGLKTSRLETLVSAADQASLAGASASDPSVTAFAYPCTRARRSRATRDSNAAPASAAPACAATGPAVATRRVRPARAPPTAARPRPSVAWPACASSRERGSLDVGRRTARPSLPSAPIETHD